MTITRDVMRWAWKSVLVTLLSACRQSGSADGAAHPARAMAVECAADSLRPVEAAPAPGLWVSERDDRPTRVAAMVGPYSEHRELTHITRRVETLEMRDGIAPIRLGSDTASVTLELLPPFGVHVSSNDAHEGRHSQPAAVYAITPLALLASYEPCDATAGEPRLRYLRRDEHGAVATDLMLRRESGETAGTFP